MDAEFFGFGRWDAPYWFIGPEQGKGKVEESSNAPRIRAWDNLGKPDICDCFEFHKLIPDLTWHTGKPPLQATWGSLILTLRAFQGEAIDTDARRYYQRDHWGRVHGETCVIDLSGTASRTLRASEVREQNRTARIEYIRAKIDHHEPVFVVMYGVSDHTAWNQIAGAPLTQDTVKRMGGTLFVFAPHVHQRGRTNADWIRLGISLKNACVTRS